MNTETLDSRAIGVGFVCALVALPFSIGIGGFAVRFDPLVALFFDSSWFAFKATVGVLEIVAFGLGAVASLANRRE